MNRTGNSSAEQNRTFQNRTEQQNFLFWNYVSVIFGSFVLNRRFFACSVLVLFWFFAEQKQNRPFFGGTEQNISEQEQNRKMSVLSLFKYPIGSSCAFQSVDAIITTDNHVQKRLRSARKRPGSIPGRIILRFSKCSYNNDNRFLRTKEAQECP